MNIVNHKDNREEPTTSSEDLTNSSNATPYRTMFPILERQLKAPRCRSPTNSETHNVSNDSKQRNEIDSRDSPDTSQSKVSLQGCITQTFQPLQEPNVLTSSVDSQSTYNYYNNDKLPSYLQACASKAASQQYSVAGSTHPSSILSALQNSQPKGSTQHHTSADVGAFMVDRQAGGWSSSNSSLRPIYQGSSVMTTDSCINPDSGTSIDMFTSQSRAFGMQDRRSLTGNLASDHHSLPPNKDHCHSTYSLVDGQNIRSHDLNANMTSYSSTNTQSYSSYMVCQMPVQYNDAPADNPILLPSLPSNSTCPILPYSHQDTYYRFLTADFQGPGQTSCMNVNDASQSFRLLPSASQCLSTPITVPESTRANDPLLGQTMTTFTTRPATYKPVSYENNYYIPHEDLSLSHQVLSTGSNLLEKDALPGSRPPMLSMGQDSIGSVNTIHYQGDPVVPPDFQSSGEIKPSSSNLYCTLCWPDGHSCSSDSGAASVSLPLPTPVRTTGPNSELQHPQTEIALRRKPRYVTVKDMLMERARQRYYERCQPCFPPAVTSSSCNILNDHEDTVSVPAYSNSGNSCHSMTNVRPMMMAKPYNANTQSVSVHLPNNGTIPSCISHPAVIQGTNLPVGRLQTMGMASNAPLVVVHNPRVPMMPAFIRRGRTILKGQGQDLNSCSQQPMSILQAKLMEVNRPMTPVPIGDVKPAPAHPFLTVVPPLPNSSVIQEKLRQPPQMISSGRILETGPESIRKSPQVSSSYIALPSGELFCHTRVLESLFSGVKFKV